MLTDDIKLPELVATTIPGYSAPFDRLVTAAYAEQYAVAAVIADREARAAAQAKNGPAVAGWQPIETAPKDGARVLTFRYGFLESFAVAWFNSSGCGDAGWRPVHGSSWPHPTHWMPLPTAPSPEGGAS